MVRAWIILAVALIALGLGATAAWGLISLAFVALLAFVLGLVWKLWPRRPQGGTGTSVTRAPDE